LGKEYPIFEYGFAASDRNIAYYQEVWTV